MLGSLSSRFSDVRARIITLFFPKKNLSVRLLQNELYKPACTKGGSEFLESVISPVMWLDYINRRIFCNALLDVLNELALSSFSLLLCGGKRN